MAKIYNNIITTTSGFNYPANQPLDDRAVVQLPSDLDDFQSNNLSYDGMEVYVVSEKTSYKLIDGVWVEMTSKGYVDTQIAALTKQIKTLTDEITALKTNVQNIDNYMDDRYFVIENDEEAE